MWNSTKIMAEAIAEGIHAADPSVTVKLMNTSEQERCYYGSV